MDRDYRALANPEFGANVYLQGFCEASHGLSDTLLSVLPARAAEIGQSLYQHLGKQASNAPASLRQTCA
ncbi:L-ornithine 5-monooxygenase [compost metagenome]